MLERKRLKRLIRLITRIVHVTIIFLLISTNISFSEEWESFLPAEENNKKDNISIIEKKEKFYNTFELGIEKAELKVPFMSLGVEKGNLSYYFNIGSNLYEKNDYKIGAAVSGVGFKIFSSESQSGLYLNVGGELLLIFGSKHFKNVNNVNIDDYYYTDRDVNIFISKVNVVGGLGYKLKLDKVFLSSEIGLKAALFNIYDLTDEYSNNVNYTPGVFEFSDGGYVYDTLPSELENPDDIQFYIIVSLGISM